MTWVFGLSNRITNCLRVIRN
ncbi:DUF3265 domain-containing protein, partial [Vibrio anguillarum]|nr:DUF3265 domain-containing protein [Vibrio anguillarum]